MIGTLMIAGLCLALGAILGYAYNPIKVKFIDPLNQATITNETEAVIRRWRKVAWSGPDGLHDLWAVKHSLMEPMLDAIGCSYSHDRR